MSFQLTDSVSASTGYFSNLNCTGLSTKVIVTQSDAIVVSSNSPSDNVPIYDVNAAITNGEVGKVANLGQLYSFNGNTYRYCYTVNNMGVLGEALQARNLVGTQQVPGVVIPAVAQDLVNKTITVTYPFPLVEDQLKNYMLSATDGSFGVDYLIVSNPALAAPGNVTLTLNITGQNVAGAYPSNVIISGSPYLIESFKGTGVQLPIGVSTVDHFAGQGYVWIQTSGITTLKQTDALAAGETLMDPGKKVIPGTASIGRGAGLDTTNPAFTNLPVIGTCLIGAAAVGQMGLIRLDLE